MEKMEKIIKQKNQSCQCILRLVSISQEYQPDKIKEPQIDEIRRKLRALYKGNQKSLYERGPSKQNRLQSYIKTEAFCMTVAKGDKKRKVELKKSSKKENKQVGNELKQIKDKLCPDILDNELDLRKIKTEYCQMTPEKNIKYTSIKHQSETILKHQTITVGRNGNIIDMQKYLIIKSQKIPTSQNILQKIRISDDLKKLQKQISDIPSEDKVNQRQKIGSSQTKFTQKKNQAIEQLEGTKIGSNKSLSPKIKRVMQFRVKKTPKISLKIEQLPFKYIDFIRFMASYNQLTLALPEISYKFYISKGNNDEIIRRIMKRRKWIETSKIQEANFVWSPKREEKYFNLAERIQMSQAARKKKQQNFLFLCSCKKQQDEDCHCAFRRLLKINQYQFQNICYQNESYFDGIRSGYKCTFPSQNVNKIESNSLRIHNHLINHHELAYKKLLFSNLTQYFISKSMDPFQYIPLTYHIQDTKSQNWQKFCRTYYEKKLKSHQKVYWIIKPAQNTNRGTGIKVQEDIYNIKQISQQIINQNQFGNSSVIIQQYIKPLLYNKRKFDIRCYVLATVIDSKVKAYWYQQGYVRTSSKIFNISKTQNKFIHLTNDAIQKCSSDYGKYEPGNKVSFENLSKNIKANYQNKNFQTDIYPQMIKISKLAFQSTFSKLHEANKGICFQIFGLDFMIDEKFKVWLIQVNRNPCLETSTGLLNRIISEMIQNSFRIALDPILPPIDQAIQSFDRNNQDSFQMNKFLLILDKQMPQRHEKNLNLIKSKSSYD